MIPSVVQSTKGHKIKELDSILSEIGHRFINPSANLDCLSLRQEQEMSHVRMILCRDAQRITYFLYFFKGHNLFAMIRSHVLLILDTKISSTSYYISDPGLAGWLYDFNS